MDKLKVFKNKRQQFSDLIRYSNSTRQSQFVDEYARPEAKNVEFKHTWANMAHMHDLRVWTLAYGPGKDNMRRMQEIHHLNAEMWYQVSHAMWKRILFFTFVWFVLNKTSKNRFMNSGARDSHEANYRETPAHM